jgi:outer membrane murein-binding lipoprotein Lpp
MEAVIAGLLAPFLSSLLVIGKQAGTQAAEALGSEAGQLASRVWDRLSGRVESKPAAKEAAEDVAAQPDDELARSALQLQIRKILQDDEELRQELTAILEEGQRAGIVADRGGVVIQGGVNATQGGVATIGDVEGGIRTGGG